ncbi:uncharacterized protein CC84DRAFT_1215988 [Paraphaeosphaeria sporulosa]|uniref:Uncharacterized protein n=1 Tax=Paraphaeosphaeria sporulosa TaxID=1460663 RepID=A0A177CI37_9PLEO|nr:uncharacterized protein CC84DRAFT_1215988 [Paraphaeosphaeria sporulosa]OAG06976.1 hypothetical protein CC84DRAFT_1215988 [Paraphaeosphaeria sporulosa]
MSHPRRSASQPSHHLSQYHPRPTPTVPETKTLEWHKQNFYNQQQAWRMQTAIEAASSPSGQANRKPPLGLNKPPPVRGMVTDARRTLRVVNADRTSTPTPDPESLRIRLAALRDSDVVAVAPLSTPSSAGSSICRTPLAKTSREEVSSANSAAAGRPARSQPGSPPHAKTAASSIPGQNTGEHAHTSRLPSEVGSPGLLDVPLSVYGFRSTLPAELQPKEPPLRWDDEPAPQIPPIASDAARDLYEDAELMEFMTANKSYLEPFLEMMPVATTIVKGKLDEVVET